MIPLDKNNFKSLIVLVILIIFTLFSFNHMKEYYNEMINSTGLINDNIEKNVKAENVQALEDNREYQNLLNSSLDGNEPEGGLSENDQVGPVTDDKELYIPKDLKLHALSSVLLDADNNRVLYGKNSDHRMPMASTTKIMTCIVALENADLNSIITFSSYAAGMPDVQLNAKKGDQFYLRDLLYSLMLESHNDVAVAIAENIGGSVEGFASMMNDKAKALGCLDTNFVTPNGLDAKDHYTTARDLAVIASYAIKNEKFIAITNTSSHNFKEIKKGREYSVTNKNKFLYMMEGAIGVKTGFTNDAGYCFVGAVKEDNKTLISVVLGCGWPPNKSLKWSDTKQLMTYGVDNFDEKQIFQDIDFDPVFVKDGQQRYAYLNIKGDLSLLLGKNEKVNIVYDIPNSLTAPIKAESVVGKASYYIGDQLYRDIPIYTTQNISQIDFKFCLNKLLRLWSAQY